MAAIMRWIQGAQKPYRYAMAFFVFATALGLRLLILPVEAGLAFTTFYPAVFLAYYFLGLGPGTLVLLLSTFTGYYIFQPPFWSLDVTVNGALVTSTFLLSNSLVGWLTLRHTRDLAKLEQSNAVQQELHQQLEIALNDAQDLYAKAPFGYYSLSPEGLIVQHNEKFLSWIEADGRNVLGTPIAAYFDTEGQKQFRSHFPKFKRDGYIEGLEFDLIGMKGTKRRISVSATAVFDNHGVMLKTRSVMFDITELEAAKRHVDNQHRLLDGVVNGLPFGVALFDDKQILHNYNKRFTQLLRVSDEVLKTPGFSFKDLIRMNGQRGDYGNQSWEVIYNKLGGLMQQRLGTQFERQTHDGNWLDISGVPVFEGWTLLTYVDITASKRTTLELEKAQQVALQAIADQKVAHEQAQYIAYHDHLTGLPNRRLFADRADQALAVASRQKHKLAICYLDLDGFKQVNDSYGHDSGDHLLVTVAKRLTECVRAQDTVCRLGGDEFVLLLTDFEREDEVRSVLQRILVEISEPVPLKSRVNAAVSVSIGYSLFPDDADDRGILMQQADQAMYEAKKQGKNCVLRHQLAQE